MSKESFKNFVRNNPNLARYVNNNEVSWQKLYETYELYGENNDVWSDFINDNNSDRNSPIVTKNNELAFKELINMVRNIDLEKVRSGITGVQKAISLVQDLGFGGGNNNTNKEQYEARPMYQHFDD